jgi:hypothetical protein
MSAEPGQFAGMLLMLCVMPHQPWSDTLRNLLFLCGNRRGAFTGLKTEEGFWQDEKAFTPSLAACLQATASAEVRVEL